MSSTSSVASSAFSRASAHALSFSSASSASSPFSGASHVDHRGFLKSSCRAGGPVLTSLPAWTTENTFTDNPVQTHDRAIKILDDLEIRFSVVVLKGRISKVDPEHTPIPTVLVLMPDHPQPDLWYQAAKQIHRDLEPSLPGISVEIIEEKLYDGLHCFPVERTHSIYSKWKKIAETILMNVNIREWTGLECWRYGTNTAGHLNPVTIIVEVDKTSTGSFLTAAQLIRGILAHFSESSADVLFMKDGKQPLVENLTIHRDACSGAVYPGVSIGIHGTSAGTYTLGGLVQLQLPNESRWRTYGLTCFHAVWPPEENRSQQMLQIVGAETALSNWEYGPLRLELPPSAIARQILRVDHPSLRDLRRTITSIDDNIESSRTKEFLELEVTQRAIDEGEDLWMPESASRRYKAVARHIRTLQAARQPFVAMYDNRTYFLGYVAAGSGVYRTRTNDVGQTVSMDWALVDIAPGRIQAQMHGDEVDGNRPFHRDSTAFTPPSEFLFNPQLQADPPMNLYKSGRSTGTTHGYYNGLVAVGIYRRRTANGGFEKVVTWEHAIAGSVSQPFAEPGDSGSWVYTSTGEVFGVLNSGNRRKNTMSISCIFDIFKDIKELTHAEVRIAPCPQLP
ncbi:hypothetical protein N7447_009976 [Penicillium robsamsonii]|uniref:uncharacterized protein n=1 Tax=Penicillium robsamsonii TaxID=1792511 RepID=UPI0025494314|nr:uncharacterized protein N7447_009976 [Penicillium robsamsonii]KAJ5812953.1 hypothetical protein N7447_009976 [Penicillium robsamsonii]